MSKKKDYPLLSTLQALGRKMACAFGQDVPLLPYELQGFEVRTVTEEVRALALLPGLSPQSLSLMEQTAMGIVHHAGIAVTLTPMLLDDAGKYMDRRNEAITALYDSARDSRASAQQRKAAAEALEYLGMLEQAAQIWVDLGQNERIRAGIRIQAANALHRLGHSHDAANILLAIAGDERIRVSTRLNAAKSLGGMGDGNRAIPILLDMVGDHQIASADRIRAAETLAKLKDPAQASSVYLLLMKDRTVAGMTRIEAAERLGGLGRADEVIRELQSLTWQDEDAAVRVEAGRVLGEFGHPDEAIKSLISNAEDSCVMFWTRFRAIWLLHGMKCTQRAVDVLQSMTREDELGDNIRQMAVDMLKELRLRKFD